MTNVTLALSKANFHTESWARAKGTERDGWIENNIKEIYNGYFITYNINFNP